MKKFLKILFSTLRNKKTAQVLIVALEKLDFE